MPFGTEPPAPTFQTTGQKLTRKKARARAVLSVYTGFDINFPHLSSRARASTNAGVTVPCGVVYSTLLDVSC